MEKEIEVQFSKKSNMRGGPMYEYGFANEGIVVVNSYYEEPQEMSSLNIPHAVFMVINNRPVNKEVVGLHTLKTAKYPMCTRMFFSCKYIKHFKTYPGQFPRLERIFIAQGKKAVTKDYLDQIMIDLLTNNPELKKRIPEIIISTKPGSPNVVYSFDIKKLDNQKAKEVEEEKNKKSGASKYEFVSTFAMNIENPFRLKEALSIDRLEFSIKDLPSKPSRKKIPDYGFVLTKECKNIKEIVIPEGITGFEIAQDVDFDTFLMKSISFPSSLSVTNILPRLNAFKNLMLVLIKPAKKIQTKFSKSHFIVANVKKKMKDSLFYTYSYAEGRGEYDSPFCYGTYGGITYVSHFKKENLLHHEKGYYYLVENEQGKAYRLLKTDFVDTFKLPTEINGIPVKYLDRNCFSNCKNDPAEKEVVILGQDWEIDGIFAYAKKRNLELIEE